MEYSLAAQLPLCLAVVTIIIDSSILQTVAALVMCRYPPPLGWLVPQPLASELKI